MTLHLGLDLGGTNIKVAVIERNGADHLVEQRTVPTEAARGPDVVAANLVAAGRGVLAEHDIDSVGLGVPGLFDQESGQIELFPNLPGPWKGYPLRDTVADGLAMPVEMINDARAFTLAEGMMGAGEGCHTVACITLGTGVGGGIMINGTLHTGAFGVAGELAHQTIVIDGPACGCGNRGCVEALTKADVLTELGGQETAAAVFDAASAGDGRALDAVRQVAGYLGVGLANVVTILGPDRIVIGGGIAQAGDLVLDEIRHSVRSRVTLVPTDQIEIVPAEFGSYAGAVGAALAGALAD